MAFIGSLAGVLLAVGVFARTIVETSWVAVVAELFGGAAFLVMLSTAPDRVYRVVQIGGEVGKDVVFWAASACTSILMVILVVLTLVLVLDWHHRDPVTATAVCSILTLVGFGVCGVLLPPTVSRRWRPTYASRAALAALLVIALVGGDIVLGAALVEPGGETWTPLLIGGLVALNVAGLRQFVVAVQRQRERLDEIVELFDDTITVIEQTVPWHGVTSPVDRVTLDDGLRKLDRRLLRASWPRRRRDLAEADLHVLEYLVWSAHSAGFTSSNTIAPRELDPILGDSGRPAALVLRDGLHLIRQRLVDHRLLDSV